MALSNILDVYIQISGRNTHVVYVMDSGMTAVGKESLRYFLLANVFYFMF